MQCPEGFFLFPSNKLRAFKYPSGTKTDPSIGTIWSAHLGAEAKPHLLPTQEYYSLGIFGLSNSSTCLKISGCRLQQLARTHL